MKIFLVITIMLSLSLKGYSQLKKSNIQGAYIYNFAKLSYSEKQSNMRSYNMVAFSDNKDMIAELRSMEQSVTISGKPIQLITNPSIDNNLKKACLIFIGPEKSLLLPQIFKLTKESEVLIVSDNYINKSLIMLNLYASEDNKVKFEMNKGNIYERGININDSVLLMGGNVVDLAEVYIHSQRKLAQSNEQLKSMLDSLKSLSVLLELNQKKINEQLLKLDSEKEIINSQKETINIQKSKQGQLTSNLSEYQKQLTTQIGANEQNEEKLRIFNDSLQQSKAMLDDFKERIDHNNEILRKQNEEISSNKEILEQKNRKIELQNHIVITFIIGTSIILTMFLLLLKGFKDKKKKNEQLRKQRNEISEQVEVLEKNKNLIESMMDELGETNEELTTMLEEKERIQNKLVQSEKMASLGVLSAGIAHEINNPINFVYAGINSLLRDFEDIEPVINEVSKLDIDHDNLKEKIALIKQLKEENYFDDAIEAIPHIINDIKLGADRTAEIVKGLRNFSRMDKESLQPLQVNEGLDTSLLLLKNKYKTRIEVIKQYEQDLPDLFCYPGKVNQAFLNILNNAIDAIEDKGTITIISYQQDNELVISIKDTGCGISEEIQGKIYDPFYTTKDVGEGTGLGLSITYGIIGEHNGSIELKSEVGMGSEFIIKLPLSN